MMLGFIAKPHTASAQLPAPTGLLFFPVNGSPASELRFQWNRVVAPSESYEIHVASDAAFGQIIQTHAIPYSGLNIQAKNIAGLLPYTTYYARIRAISNMGTTGTFSVVTQGTTRAVGPEWLAPSNLGSGTSFTLNWTPVTNASSYTIQIFPLGLQPTTHANITGTSFTFNNAVQGVQYSYFIWAVMPNGSRSTMPTATALRLPPSQPVQLPPTNISLTTATINWQPVIGAQNISVQISPSITFNQLGPTQNVSTSATTLTFSNIALQPATTYYSRVLASNNGIPINTTFSNVVSFVTPAAMLTIPVPAISHSSNPGVGGFQVTANVPWTASSNSGWITVNPSSGNGTQNFQYSMMMNPLLVPRTGIITFTGGGITRTLTVTQGAAPQASSTLVLSSTMSNVQADSTFVGFGVSSNVSWMVTSNVAWLNVVTKSGTGNASVMVGVSPNTQNSPRTGILTIVGGGISRTFTVTQEATPQASPTLVLSSSTASVLAVQNTFSFGVSSNQIWTAQSNATWLTISPTSGTGHGTINVSVAQNPTPIQRFGTITVSGGGLQRTLTVYQNAAMADTLPAPQNVVATATMQQNFTVQWQPVAGASNYEIQHATDVNFTDNFFSFLTSNPSVLASASPQWSVSAKPGTTYFVRMRSVNASGLRSVFSNVDTASTPPNQPFMLSASNITQTSFRVNWQLAEGAASYTLQVSTNATFTANGILNTFTNILGGTNNFTVTNQLLGVDLKAGAVYFFRVQSVSSAGVRSGFATGSLAIPSSQLLAPSGVAVNNVSKTGFTVNWQAVAGASGYEVQVSTNQKFEVGNTTFFAQGGSTTSLQVNNLLPGSLRYVRVRTLDAANGGSAYSSGVLVTTLPPAPAVPLAATNIGTNSFTANWQNSPDGGTTTLEVIFDSGIRYQYQVAGTSYTVTNLQAGRVVFYRVRANGGGAMTVPFSTQQIRVELQSNQAGLATPTAYMATNIGMDNAIARWSLVSGATGYELQVASDVQFTNILRTYPSSVQAASAPQLMLTGLPVGKLSFYRVRAFGANNVATPFSNIVSIGTMPATPVIAAPTNIQAISFTANWQSANGAKLYHIQTATNTQFTQDLVNAYTNPATPQQTGYTFTVPAGKQYYYRVRAIGEAGSGLWSNFQTVTLAQGMTGGLVAFDAVNPSSTSFVALWQPITGAASYTIQIATNPNFNQVIRTFANINSTTLTVNGLQAGFTYYYRVIANAALAGSKDGSMLNNDASSNVVAVTLPADVPTALEAANIGTSGFTAQWESVGDEAAYIIQVATDAGFTTILSQTNAAKQTTSEFIGVPFAPTYFYRVLAVSDAGSSSAPSNVITVRMMTTSVRSGSIMNTSSVSVYPNPAGRSESRAIQFTLPQSGQITVRIIDMLGKEIASVPHGYKASGQHTLTIGQELNLSSGMYMIRLEVNGNVVGSAPVMVR
jgi:hypothetical protein